MNPCFLKVDKGTESQENATVKVVNDCVNLENYVYDQIAKKLDMSVNEIRAR
jgi:hypothetical protein